MSDDVLFDDPSLPFPQSIPVDDHMTHRGHGVFDTAVIRHGCAYQLDKHLDRLLASAGMAEIPCPRRESMRDIILHTAAASRIEDGYIRFWVTAGRGGFGLSPRECVKPGFYVIVYGDNPTSTSGAWSGVEEGIGGERDTMKEYTGHGDPARGWKVMTTSIAAKPGVFARIKSNNYLQNAMCLMEAEAAGFDQGVFVDDQGHVLEGPNMNVMALTLEGELVTPPLDSVLAGITVQRVQELVQKHLDEGTLGDFEELEPIKKVTQRPIGVDEIKTCAEVMMVGTSVKVFPVIQWGSITIGDGSPGRVALALRNMVDVDMNVRGPGKTGPGDQHVEIPYQMLTRRD